MNEKSKRHKNDKEYVQYERMIQKLESDVRGHFKVRKTILIMHTARARNEDSHGLPRGKDRTTYDLARGSERPNRVTFH